MSLQGRFHTIHCTTIQKTVIPFNIPNRYVPVGNNSIEGGEACVIHAHDRVTHKDVAIKKRKKPFSHKDLAKRTHREFVLSQMVNHTNVIKLLNAFTPNEKYEDFNEVYYVTEFVTYPLSVLIHKNIFATGEQVSWIIYQILCGVKHLHKTNIAHRDFSGNNILVNKDFSVKIIDFGLARQMPEDVPKSKYVTTRPYRAPEIILDIDYDKKVDIWSIGCIMSYMLTKQQMFVGSDELNHWLTIIQKLGTPSETFINKIDNPGIRDFIAGQPRYEPRPWEELFPDEVFPQRGEPGKVPLCEALYGRDLLSKMLQIDPAMRVSAEEALYHPYVMWTDGGGEQNTDTNPFRRYNGYIDDMNQNEEVWKAIIFAELKQYERDHDIFGNIDASHTCQACMVNRCTCSVCSGMSIQLSTSSFSTPSL